jgi:hypothetical protein
MQLEQSFRGGGVTRQHDVKVAMHDDGYAKATCGYLDATTI